MHVSVLHPRILIIYPEFHVLFKYDTYRFLSGLKTSVYINYEISRDNTVKFVNKYIPQEVKGVIITTPTTHADTKTITRE